MSDLIDDRAIDALTIVWEQTANYTGPRVIDSPPSLRIVKSFLSRDSWQHFVQFISPGVVQRHGRVAEYSGFQFQADIEPGDPGFDGVEMFDPPRAARAMVVVVRRRRAHRSRAFRSDVGRARAPAADRLGSRRDR